MTETERIAAILRRVRFVSPTEEVLQDAIAEVLADNGVSVRREVRLPGGRIDLLVSGDVGVEVKIAGATPNVARQVNRYLACDAIAGLVLVTGRVKHMQAGFASGKPVEVVTIAWGGL